MLTAARPRAEQKLILHPGAQGSHLFLLGEDVAGASCISWSRCTASSWRTCSRDGDAAASGPPRVGDSAASYATTEPDGGGLARLLAPAPVQSKPVRKQHRRDL